MARKKATKISTEEMHRQMLERELNDCRKQYLNEPPYVYEIGQRVIHGSIPQSYITEIHDNGKIYCLHEFLIDNDNKPYERDMYVSWVDITPWQDQTNIPSLINPNRIDLHFINSQVDSLLTMYYHFGVDMTPDYQRDYVWTIRDKQMLIDSIFNHIDIGKFVFIRNEIKENNKLYQILDGKQRLQTLVDFVENRFHYKGYLFNNLSARDQRFFTNSKTVYASISNISEKDIYYYFIVLNTSGKVMDEAHLSNVRKLLQD